MQNDLRKKIEIKPLQNGHTSNGYGSMNGRRKQMFCDTASEAKEKKFMVNSLCLPRISQQRVVVIVGFEFFSRCLYIVC